MHTVAAWLGGHAMVERCVVFDCKLDAAQQQQLQLSSAAAL
jgi:hypothetical protein